MGLTRNAAAHVVGQVKLPGSESRYRGGFLAFIDSIAYFTKSPIYLASVIRCASFIVTRQGLPLLFSQSARDFSRQMCFALDSRFALNGLLARMRSVFFADRCRANMAHSRQSRPDSCLGFQEGVLKPFEDDPSWPASGNGLLARRRAS